MSKVIYAGGEHEVKCDGFHHWCYVKGESAGIYRGPCDCPKPAFSKQHYEAIVKALEPLGVTVNLGEVVNALSDMFEADNPLFDRGKFWEACFKEEKADV